MKQFTIYFGGMSAYYLEAESMVAAIDLFHKEVGEHEIEKIEKTSAVIDWSESKPVDHVFPSIAVLSHEQVEEISSIMEQRVETIILNEDPSKGIGFKIKPSEVSGRI